MAELLPRAEGAAAARASATTSASTSTPRRPTGSSSRSTCSRRLCFDPELAGWNGIGFVVQAYQKRCPFVLDWLIDLARRTGHRLMVRLVKGAYWDSEIKRAQVDGLAGYPVYTRKVHTDVSYLACAQQAARRARRGLPAVRHPQRATRWPRSTSWPGRGTGDCTSSSACTAWARPLYDAGRRRRRRQARTAPAASTRRSARTRRCSPTSCAACSRTAPTPRSSTASSIRAVSIDELVADPVGRRRERARRRARLPHPRSRCRATSTAPSAPTRRGIDLAERARRCAGSTSGLAARGAELDAPRPIARASRRADDPAQRRRRSATPPTTPTSSARSARPTPTTSSAALAAAEAAAPRWAATAAGRARRLPRARRRPAWRRELPRADGPGRPRGRQDAARTRIAEVREAVDFCRYYAARSRAREFDDAPTRAARPGRLHQPVELPARHLHRPGRAPRSPPATPCSPSPPSRPR